MFAVRRLTPVLLATVGFGCVDDPASSSQRTTSKPMTTPEKKATEYEPATRIPVGHDDELEVETRLAADTLHVKITVGSGGYVLEHLKSEAAADHTEVRLRLTYPARGEATTDAIEHLELEIPLPRDSRPLHLYLQHILRGAKYESELPPSTRVKVIER